MKHDLTTGSVAKTLIKFTIPLILANLLQALYGIADMVIVGLFSGPQSLSAVSTSGQVTMVITMFISGLTIGATVMVAQYQGAKEFEEQNKTIGSIFCLGLAVSVIITAITLFAGNLILEALNTPEEAYSEAYKYFVICILGTVFITGYNVVSSIMRGKGDSRTPFIMVAIAAVTNVVLDLVLVAVFDMGAAGAAIATVFSQALSMLMSIIFLKGSFAGFKLKYVRFYKDKIKKLLSIGIPSSIQQTLVSFSFLFLLSIINSFGVDQSAASGIVAKVNSFAVLPGVAMLIAISSMSGQNIGAGQLDRAMQTMITGIKVLVPIVLIIFAIIFTFPGAIMRAFTDDANVIELGIKYMRYSSGEYILLSIVFCLHGLLTGAGHTTLTMINSFTSSIIVRIPLSVVFAKHFGFNGIALAVSVAPFASLILALIYIKSGVWKKTPLKIGDSD